MITASAHILIFVLPSRAGLWSRILRVQDENFHPFILKAPEAGGKQWVGERRVCSLNESAFHNLYVRIENRGEKRSVSDSAAVVPAYGDFLKMCVCVVVGFGMQAMENGTRTDTHRSGGQGSVLTKAKEPTK